MLVRTVRVRARVRREVCFALKEVGEEYREVLGDAINYGLSNNTISFTRIKAGIYRTERERHLLSSLSYLIFAITSHKPSKVLFSLIYLILLMMINS